MIARLIKIPINNLQYRDFYLILSGSFEFAFDFMTVSPMLFIFAIKLGKDLKLGEQ